MLLSMTYWVCLAACCAIAWRRGGECERIGASILAAGSAASALICSHAGFRFQGSELGLVVVDVAVLVALVVLSLRSPRVWPIWVAGFHLVAIMTHAAVFVHPAILPRAYALAQGFWAYPMMAALAVGAHFRTERSGAITFAAAATTPARSSGSHGDASALAAPNRHRARQRSMGVALCCPAFSQMWHRSPK